jgi:hypothetical protein
MTNLDNYLSIGRNIIFFSLQPTVPSATTGTPLMGNIHSKDRRKAGEHATAFTRGKQKIGEDSKFTTEARDVDQMTPHRNVKNTSFYLHYISIKY